MFKSIKFSFLIVTIALSSCAKLPVETTFNGVPTSYLSTKSHNDFGDVLATIVYIAIGLKLGRKLVEKYVAKDVDLR
jgi:hypothetical protein